MPNFLQHEKVDDTWFSSPFYTENGGYKLQLAVHANGVGVGIGEGSHVSVFAYLMKSENDDSLKWPFSGDITVQLLNWREDKGHVEVILNNTTPDCCNRVTKGERAVSAMRYRQFISHDNVEYNPDKNTQYVHNDTMCFRISKVSFPTGTIIRNSLQYMIIVDVFTNHKKTVSFYNYACTSINNQSHYNYSCSIIEGTVIL